MANKDKWSLGAAVLASVATILAYFGGKNEASDDGTLTSALNPCNPDTVTHLCTDETSADAKMTYMYQDSVFGTPKSCSDITISSLRQSGTTKYSCTKCPFLPQYENNFITAGVGNLNAFVDIKCWAPDNYNAISSSGLPQIPRLQQDNTVQEGNPCREPDGSALPSLDYKVGQVQPVGVNVDYVRCMRNDDSGKYVWMKFSYSADDGVFDKMVKFSQYCTGLLVPESTDSFTSKMQYFVQGPLTTQEETIQDAQIANKTCVANNYTTSTSLDANHDYANVASCYGKTNNGDYTYQCPAGYQIQLSGCTQCPAGTVNGEVNGYGCSACEGAQEANSDRTKCVCRSGYTTAAGMGCVCEDFEVTLSNTDKSCSSGNAVVPTDKTSWWGINADTEYPANIDVDGKTAYQSNVFCEYDHTPNYAKATGGHGTVNFWWAYGGDCGPVGRYRLATSPSHASAKSNDGTVDCYQKCPEAGLVQRNISSGQSLYLEPWHTCVDNQGESHELIFVTFENTCVNPRRCDSFSSHSCAGEEIDARSCSNCTKEEDCLSWCYGQATDGCCYRTDSGACVFYENGVTMPGTSSQHAAQCYGT